MNKDQKLLEEAYQSIYESVKEPLYFGPEKYKQKWMKWLNKRKHEVHEDGSVSVKEDVFLESIGMVRIFFNFRMVTGIFSCHNNKLMSLEGAPKEVEGEFNCSYNKLTSLEGAPKKVKGEFNCAHNDLTSLKGAPKEVEGPFKCNHNNLTSLEEAPEMVRGYFSCYENKLASLQGAPKEIRGDFNGDQFSDEDYRAFVKKRKYVDSKLDKELDVDLEDFS